MSDGKKNTLEIWVVEQIKKFDRSAHRVSGSGCGDLQKADISCQKFFIECKMRRTQKNIIVQYKELWLKLLDQMPCNSSKTPLIIIENAFGEKFVTLKAEDFFDLMNDAKLAD